MALQFQPPNLPETKTKTEALLEPVSQTIQGLPNAIIAYQQLKKERDLKAREHATNRLTSKKGILDLMKGSKTWNPETKQYDITPGLELPEGAITYDEHGYPDIDLTKVMPGQKVTPPLKATSSSNYANIREAMANENRKLSIIKTIQNDPQARDLVKRFDMLAQASSMVEQKNPVADEVIKTVIAKSVGKDAGALSEKDIARYGGSKAIVTRLDQAFEEMKSGVWNDENRQFVRNILEAAQVNAEEQYRIQAEVMAGRLGYSTDLFTDPELLTMAMKELDVRKKHKDVDTSNKKDDPLGIRD